MNAWKKITTNVLSEVGAAVGEDLSGAQADTPPDQNMGDIAIPCFEFAKKLKKSPAEIAKAWADKVESTDLIEKAMAAGPYLNVMLEPAALSDYIFDGLADISKKGDEGKGKTVMVEYSQPNTHKEFHVGHLRNASLGSTLVELYRKLGYKVIAANYIGDIGAHVAKCLWAMQNLHAGEEPPKGKEGAWLGELYVEGHQKMKDDKEAQEQSKEILRKLEAGDPELKALWEKTKEWSMQQFRAVYDDMGVVFDKWYFESEVEEPGKEVVKELLEKGIAKVSQGATIVDLESEGLGVFLILRSDGTSLYSTKDLALAKQKFQEYKLDESIIVVDNRQSQHFKQLFRTLQLYGFDKSMTHVAYEMVDTKEGTMSSRSGNVIKYEEIREEVLNKLKKETKQRHADWSDKKIEEAAHGIMLAALKFMMLKSDANKIITFDMDAALSFEGYTGPYIQYSYARIQSMIRKEGKGKSGALDSPEEKQLFILLSQFYSAVEDAKKTHNPAVLCRYVYEVAKQYSHFYARHQVIGSKEQEARLALSDATAKVLKEGLNILGIPALDQM